MDDFQAELAQYQKDLGPARAAAQAAADGTLDKEAVRKVAGPIQEFRAMAEMGYARIVPPEPGQPRDHWQTAGASLLETARVHPAMLQFAAMATAYRQGKADAFNRALDDYRAWLAPNFAHELRKGAAEFYFNDVKAFLHATIIYIFAFMLAGGAILTFTVTPNLSESLRRSAFYLVILAGLVHTFGLVFRMALEGRPPVTNLYSSAIFIGWGTWSSD